MTIGDTYINTYESTTLPAGAVVVIEDVSYDRVYYYYIIIEHIRLYDYSFHKRHTKHSTFASLETFEKNFAKYVYN